MGSGGREHALAWKLAQSRLIAQEGGTLYASPGNPGIAEEAEIVGQDDLLVSGQRRIGEQDFHYLHPVAHVEADE